MNRNKLEELLKSGKGFVVERDNSDVVVTKKFIKELRRKLNFTQVVFASVIGVSVKTIEKWEQGAVEPRLIVKKFLNLINEKPYLLNEFYNYTFEGNKYYPVTKKVDFNYVYQIRVESLSLNVSSDKYSTNFEDKHYISKISSKHNIGNQSFIS